MFMANVMAMVNDRQLHRAGGRHLQNGLHPLPRLRLEAGAGGSAGSGREAPDTACREQMVLDGTFPTVVSPNPENPEGFYLAIELADKVGADFILGTDPDSDRVGIMVRSRRRRSSSPSPATRPACCCWTT